MNLRIMMAVLLHTEFSGKVSKGIDLEVTRGLMNAYLAANKPDEAVKFLLDTRERLNTRKTSTANSVTDESEPNVDPIQVELLHGKAYLDWGHISDAIAVYDQLITAHPEDFRGYLAKGIILRENGSKGDAERMFIQARFFAQVVWAGQISNMIRKFCFSIQT